MQLGLHFLETSFLLAKVSVYRTSRLMSFALAYHRRTPNRRRPLEPTHPIGSGSHRRSSLAGPFAQLLAFLEPWLKIERHALLRSAKPSGRAATVSLVHVYERWRKVCFDSSVVASLAINMQFSACWRHSLGSPGILNLRSHAFPRR
jgi:hypothetical protein